MSHGESYTTTVAAPIQVPHLHCDELTARDISKSHSNSGAVKSDHQNKLASNDAHLGANTVRDGDTLSAGSTARNDSTTRTMENNGALEKDFSRQDRELISYTHISMYLITGSVFER